MNKLLQEFRRREEGATMIEYGLMLFLIAVACIVATTAIGFKTVDFFGAVANALADALSRVNFDLRGG